MASELSKFIEDELKDKGWRVDDEEAPQQALLGALRVEARVKEKQASKKLATWRRAICVGGGIIVVILVWLLIWRLGSGPGTPQKDVSQLFSPPPPPAVIANHTKPVAPHSKQNSSAPASPKPGVAQHGNSTKGSSKPTTSPPPSPKISSATQSKNDTHTPTAHKAPPPAHSATQTSPTADGAQQPKAPATGTNQSKSPGPVAKQPGSPAPAKPPESPVKPPEAKPGNVTTNATATNQG